MGQNLPLVYIEGIFHMKDGTELYAYPEGKPPISVDAALRKIEGEKVTMLVHHHPPSPMEPHKGGAGSCIWGVDVCPCGHWERPQWLHTWTAGGILSYEDEWKVGEEKAQLPHFLMGHRGRIITFAEREVVMPDLNDLENQKTDDLLQEAMGLTDLLKNLQSFMAEK